MTGRKRKDKCLPAAVMVALLLSAATAFSQSTDTMSVLELSVNQNTIHNSNYLDPFFEKLYHLEEGRRDVVSIIHIGDSHIQADFLTAVVRRKLQEEFGNAGRGLVVPARLAATNEPMNIRSSSSTPWAYRRMIQTRHPLPIGIGGITLQTLNSSAELRLRVTDPVVDHRFSSVGLFYMGDSSSFAFSLRDSALATIARIEPAGSADMYRDYTKASLPALYNEVIISLEKQRESQRQATLFGVVLENGRKGVLYHAIGVNGAKYEHYSKATLFAHHTVALKPDLIIISLGTNESVEYPHINASLEAHISTLVRQLGEKNPDALFILVTPPDAFIRKVRPNPGIETVRSRIIAFAVENGMAFWDMYKVNGGKNSASLWKMKGLLRPDGIHFTREGYEYQGELLFDALMKSYNQYVSLRH